MMKKKSFNWKKKEAAAAGEVERSKSDLQLKRRKHR